LKGEDNRAIEENKHKSNFTKEEEVEKLSLWNFQIGCNRL
jgi:hypothetical protein